MPNPDDQPSAPDSHPIETAIKPECDALRADLLAIEGRVRGLLRGKMSLTHDTTPQVFAQAGEMRDHQMLAVRAIEDARMRIGKVLQHSRDGVSIYDGG
jgi:hypothetical protein